MERTTEAATTKPTTQHSHHNRPHHTGAQSPDLAARAGARAVRIITLFPRLRGRECIRVDADRMRFRPHVHPEYRDTHTTLILETGEVRVVEESWQEVSAKAGRGPDLGWQDGR